MSLLSQPTRPDYDGQAETLEREAAKIMDTSLLHLPPDCGSGDSARMVTCIVQAATLRVFALLPKVVYDEISRHECMKEILNG